MSERRAHSRSLPRYRDIAERLSFAIRRGDYPPGSLLPSLAELGLTYGVSEITARHAVRVLVEERLVMPVAGKGTVVLDPRAALAPGARERRVGILLPMIVSWTPLFAALTEAFEELGDDVLLRPLARGEQCTAEPAALAELEVLRASCGRGLLLYGERTLCEAFVRSREGAEAGVCLSNSNGVPDELPLVTTDHFGSMFAVTRHLIGLGHRRIGYLDDLFHLRPGDPRWGRGTTCERRYGGFLAALDAAGLAPSGFEERLCVILRGKNAAAARELFRDPQSPSAVVCFNDGQAYSFWSLLREAGLRVPEDVALAGYDNLRPPEWLPPGAGLTTLDQNFSELARCAARLLREERQRLLEGPGRATFLLVPSRLIVRSSTAPPSDTDPRPSTPGGTR